MAGLLTRQLKPGGKVDAQHAESPSMKGTGQKYSVVTKYLERGLDHPWDYMQEGKQVKYDGATDIAGEEAKVKGRRDTNNQSRERERDSFGRSSRK